MAKRIHITSWALFLLNPFALFLYSIYQHRAKWAPNAMWAFIVFFGFTFAIGTESQGSDIVRYVEMVDYFYTNIGSFGEAYAHYMSTGDIDFFNYLIAYLVSRFTVSQAILTTVYALIFGFFYSRNIFYLIRQLRGKLHRWTWVLIILFILIVPFWQINGFRFWTATHVFLYGLLPYLIEGKKRRLWVCALSFIFHFTFVLPLLVILIYRLVPQRMMIGLGFFLFTIFYQEVNTQWLNTRLNAYAPSIFIERTDSYLSPTEVKQFRTSTYEKNWYAIWYKKALNYSISVLLVLIVLKTRKSIRLRPYIYRLLFFTLLLYGVANIASSVPSGGRFVSLAMLFGVFIITVFYQNHYRGRLARLWLPLASPTFILFIVVSVRIGFYFISVETLLGNPVIAMLTAGDTLSMNDLIKNP